MDSYTQNVAKLEEVLAWLKSLRTTPSPPLPPPLPVPAPQPTGQNNLISLLLSDAWPTAVDPSMICNDQSEEDKLMRADAILDLAQLLPLTSKRFLDFGCGEGHAVRRAKAGGAAVAVGHDIKDQDWGKHKDIMVPSGEPLQYELTTDPAKVRSLAPYDTVLIYDVVDHIVDQEPGDALKLVTDVLAPGGTVFVRCHPWCSRHGTHLYQKLNKAYAHLVFSDADLVSVGAVIMPTRKIIHPLNTYRSYFQAAGLKVHTELLNTVPVEPFFQTTPAVSELIKANWKESTEESLKNGSVFPEYQLSQQFVDYVLVKPQ